MNSPTKNYDTVILAAHGSTAHEHCNQPLFELAKLLQESLPVDCVTPAFLDGTPSVGSVMNDIVGDHVLVIPFMASEGYYTRKFRDLLSVQGKNVDFGSAIGSNPALVNIVSERLDKLISVHCETVVDPGDENPTVVVIGHGTRKNKNSCRTTIDLVMQLREKHPELEFQFAFMDQNPSLELVVSRLSQKQIIAIPFLMGLGPHVTQDIPKTFGISHVTAWNSTSDERQPQIATIQTANAETTSKIIYDLPIGTWPEMAGICHSIFQASRIGRQETQLLQTGS